MVERDDRVARKLVWLRPQEVEADELSLEDFIKRTFLARPWEYAGEFMETLDDVSGIVTDASIPRTTAGEWIRSATEIPADPNALVEALVEAWSRRGGV
jgi:hypothetical protein